MFSALVKRLIVLTVMLWLTASVATLLTAESVTDVQPEFDRLPIALAGWQGREAPPLDEEVARTLAADTYVHRFYTRADGAAVETDVAYYRRQRVGAAMHSPLNCLPGTGWALVSTDDVAVGGTTVRQAVVQRGVARLVVVYWFATPARTDASEYWNRLYRIGDALRGKRTDAALVRVIVPVDEALGDAGAAARARAFAGALLSEVTGAWRAE